MYYPYLKEHTTPYNSPYSDIWISHFSLFLKSWKRLVKRDSNIKLYRIGMTSLFLCILLPLFIVSGYHYTPISMQIGHVSNLFFFLYFFILVIFLCSYQKKKKELVEHPVKPTLPAAVDHRQEEMYRSSLQSYFSSDSQYSVAKENCSCA